MPGRTDGFRDRRPERVARDVVTHMTWLTHRNEAGQLPDGAITISGRGLMEPESSPRSALEEPLEGLTVSAGQSAERPRMARTLWECPACGQTPRGITRPRPGSPARVQRSVPLLACADPGTGRRRGARWSLSYGERCRCSRPRQDRLRRQGQLRELRCRLIRPSVAAVPPQPDRPFHQQPQRQCTAPVTPHTGGGPAATADRRQPVGPLRARGRAVAPNALDFSRCCVQA